MSGNGNRGGGEGRQRCLAPTPLSAPTVSTIFGRALIKESDMASSPITASSSASPFILHELCGSRSPRYLAIVEGLCFLGFYFAKAFCHKCMNELSTSKGNGIVFEKAVGFIDEWELVVLDWTLLVGFLAGVVISRSLSKLHANPEFMSLPLPSLEVFGAHVRLALICFVGFGILERIARALFVPMYRTPSFPFSFFFASGGVEYILENGTEPTNPWAWSSVLGTEFIQQVILCTEASARALITYSLVLIARFVRIRFLLVLCLVLFEELARPWVLVGKPVWELLPSTGIVEGSKVTILAFDMIFHGVRAILYSLTALALVSLASKTWARAWQ